MSIKKQKRQAIDLNAVEKRTMSDITNRLQKMPALILERTTYEFSLLRRVLKFVFRIEPVGTGEEHFRSGLAVRLLRFWAGL
jgi:hypothetical protein